MKLIFVDIDNTLLDFDEYVKYTLELGFKRFNLGNYAPSVYDVFKEENDRLWRRLEKKEITFDELHDIRFRIIFGRLGIDFPPAPFEKHFREELHEFAVPCKGAEEMLKYLSERYILVTASNGPYEQQIYRMKLAGFDKYFTYNFISEKCKASKPAPEFFDFAFNEINEGREEKITPKDCMIIGDSITSDMKGGHNYGMKTCYYRRVPGKIPPDWVDYILDELPDVTKMF